MSVELKEKIKVRQRKIKGGMRERERDGHAPQNKGIAERDGANKTQITDKSHKALKSIVMYG